MSWSLLPIWIIDLAGAVGMILVSTACLILARRLFWRDPENPLANYLLWFFGAIFAFAVSRSIGHIIRHLLHFAGYGQWWNRLSPVSGSINTITFVVIASVTLFFHRVQTIMGRMNRDRQKIEQTGQELLRLNRDMESIVSERTRAEMALQIAHEVRNPAMVIGGMLRRLSKTPGACISKEHLETVLAEAGKLEDLVRRFESVQPAGKLYFSSLELNAQVEEALELVQPESDEKGITILLDRSPALLTFQGNAHLLKVAVLHILRNAIEACGQGDSIQITTGIGPGGIVLTIADTGPGIPQEMLSHVFEPFYTTKKGETGLGLPHVRQIIEEHRGSVDIESTREAGTTVTITLPTHLGELARPRTGLRPLLTRKTERPPLE